MTLVKSTVRNRRIQIPLLIWLFCICAWSLGFILCHGDFPYRIWRFGGFSFQRIASDPWRIFVAPLLHGSLFHLCGNLVGLLSLGFALNLACSLTRVFLIALSGSILSMFGALLISEDAFCFGASGGVYALLGASLVVHIRKKTKEWFIRALLIIWIFCFLFGILFDDVSSRPHLAGLLFGIIFIFLPASDRVERIILNSLLILEALALIAAISLPALNPFREVARNQKTFCIRQSFIANNSKDASKASKKDASNSPDEFWSDGLIHFNFNPDPPADDSDLIDREKLRETDSEMQEIRNFSCRSYAPSEGTGAGIICRKEKLRIFLASPSKTALERPGWLDDFLWGFEETRPSCKE